MIKYLIIFVLFFSLIYATTNEIYCKSNCCYKQKAEFDFTLDKCSIENNAYQQCVTDCENIKEDSCCLSTITLLLIPIGYIIKG